MKLSVLQWNVWYQEDIRNIAKFIKSINPDVVCLQELTNKYEKQTVKDGPDYIARELGYHCSVKEIDLDEPDGRVFHLANGIYSRFEITDSHSAWINKPTGSGGYDDELRAYSEVTFRVEGELFTVGTTHMSYTHGFAETDRKRAETDALVSELSKHDKRFVFTGDLNASESSYTIRQISKSLTDVGLGTKANTWATKPFSYNGFEEDKLRWRLDYVFASHDLKVTKYEVLDTPFSDHLPVLAVFEV